MLRVASGVHASCVLLQHQLALLCGVGVLAPVGKSDLVVVIHKSVAHGPVINIVPLLQYSALVGFDLDVGGNENRVCVESGIDKVVD